MQCKIIILKTIYYHEISDTTKEWRKCVSNNMETIIDEKQNPGKLPRNIDQQRETTTKYLLSDNLNHYMLRRASNECHNKVLLMIFEWKGGIIAKSKIVFASKEKVNLFWWQHLGNEIKLFEFHRIKYTQFIVEMDVYKLKFQNFN